MKKKILFAAYSLDVGGIETALVTLLDYLKDKYEITLALEKKQGIFLDKIPESVKIIEYKISDSKTPLIRKIQNAFKQIAFKIKYKNKFDSSVCYATYSFPCSFMARNASKKSFLWVHNNYMNFYDDNILKYRKFFKDLKVYDYKNIIFVSKMDKRVFTAQFPECSKKAIVCNNLIDYKSIIKKSEEQIDDLKKEDVPVFINIGRHDEKQKKLSRIINATKKLNSEGYKFKVVFVGKGTDTNMYKDLAKKTKNIEFLGAKKNPYPYLRIADCFIMSSQFEGYPVVLVESQILGKPIVTTDISDAKEDINEKYGIVVENSEIGVYKGMKEFLDKNFVPNKFDAEKYNKEIIEKIDKILG